MYFVIIPTEDENVQAAYQVATYELAESLAMQLVEQHGKKAVIAQPLAITHTETSVRKMVAAPAPLQVKTVLKWKRVDQYNQYASNGLGQSYRIHKSTSGRYNCYLSDINSTLVSVADEGLAKDACLRHANTGAWE